MPKGDGTGPVGMGPRTGRGLGPCGLGLRRGFGRGFALRQWYPVPQMTKEEEVAELKAEKEAIEKRLKELEEKKK